ncbi:MAG: class I SAM-dependent methyltransferase [Alphaproteobacteria bacterium]|nr:class I SAM-dependent methyltransferase [Alphaproteobacteria bacterium]
MTSAKRDSSYILEVGEKGEENLNLQHKMLESNSIEQLNKAGLREGIVVWDIGCGSGEMTEYIASVVGSTGHVYAVDASEEQIKVTKKRITSADYRNVSFIVDDISSFENKSFEEADIVYSRFLLMHVKGPENVLNRMLALLKPSGVLVCQETAMDSVNNSSGNVFIDRYFQLLIAYGSQNGFDYNIGRKLQTLCSTVASFSKIDYYVTKLDLNSSNGKKLLLSRLDEFKDKLIGANLVSEQEMAEIKQGMSDYFESPRLSDCTLYTEQAHLLAFQ